MKPDLRVDLAWAAAIVLVAAAAAGLRTLGLISEDAMMRSLAMNGLALAWYGNRAPKALAPDRFCQRVNRVGGWATALSGLVYTGLWLFAPVSLAMGLGTAVLLVGVGVTAAYAWSLGRPSAAPRGG